MKNFAKFLSAIFVLLFHSRETEEAGSPNIIFILADDYGWNDVSFHGSDQIPTPNIDALAYHGVILNSHYTLPLCTPSRASLMTGLYPIHNGMQSSAILPTQKKALPEGKLLPQYLKDLNYRTVAIGKWHLGHYRDDLLPLKRGFDSFLGYYNGFNSYYDFVPEWPRSNGDYIYGFDMRRNDTPAYDLVGQYATDLFTDEAVRTIKTHDKKKPLFLYMSHLAVHAGNDGKLLEAPQETINKFMHIGETNRRTYAAMVAKMDESVGKMVAALEEKDMLKNSIIVFLADNGAPTIGIFQNWGSNWPFRGIKETLWEGAMRGVGCIWSPLITGTPRVSNGLIHISDWLPTLYRAAGGNPSRLPNIDGIDQWESITKNLPSRRTEVLLNIDDQAKASALRVNTPNHHWKIVVGTLQKGKYDGYYGQGNYLDSKDNPPYKLEAITTSDTYKSFEKLYKKYSSPPLTPRILIPFLRDQATVKCNNPVFNRKGCNPAENANNICLYDLKTDPCELNDLSFQNPYIVYKLLNKLNEYNQTVIPTPFCPLEDNIANPAYFNGTWSPWYNSDNVPIVLLRTGEIDIL